MIIASTSPEPNKPAIVVQRLPDATFPYQYKLTAEDIKSLYAYLRTIPAISNEVPQPVIAGPPPAAEGSH